VYYNPCFGLCSKVHFLLSTTAATAVHHTFMGMCPLTRHLMSYGHFSTGLSLRRPLSSDRVLEELRQKQEAQSAPQTLIDQWFERPSTSTICVLTVYPLFFCASRIDWPTETPRGKSSQGRGNVVVHFPIGLLSICCSIPF
jgi:hypothetical protein